MEQLKLVTDETERKSSPGGELPEEIEIGKIELEPGIPFYYEAWGVRYKFGGGVWIVVNMAFRKKSDALDWMDRNYSKVTNMEAELIHVKRTVLLTHDGDIQTETEELVE